MKPVAVTVAVWAVLAALWWFTVGAEVAKAQDPFARWEQIASFYAGRPIDIQEDPRGGSFATGGGGLVKLGPNLLKSLTDWEKNVKLGMRGKAGPKKAAAQQRAVVLGGMALATLIHEAVHNRDFGAVPDVMGRLDEDDWTNPRTGFYAAGNEPQAHILGSQLLPDMMRRYFGLGEKTPFSQRLRTAGAGLSNYLGAYSHQQWGGKKPDDLAQRFVASYLGGQG